MMFVMLLFLLCSYDTFTHTFKGYLTNTAAISNNCLNAHGVTLKNIGCCTVEVLECTSNFIPHFLMKTITHPYYATPCLVMVLSLGVPSLALGQP